MLTTKSLLLTLLALTLQADSIHFNNGAVVEGTITDKNANTASIDVKGVVTMYSMRDIKNISISRTIAPPPPPPAVSAKPIKSNSPLMLSAGTPLHVKTTSQIDSAHHKRGYQFTLVLESALLAKDGRVIAPQGTTVYGVVVDSKQAGRLVGKSEMIITLTAININNKRVKIRTQNINLLSPKPQAANTIGKVARAAVIGGLIDGNDGARTGAKVGLGVAVLTRGKATGVPASTLIDFTLLSDVHIN